MLGKIGDDPRFSSKSIAGEGCPTPSPDAGPSVGIAPTNTRAVAVSAKVQEKSLHVAVEAFYCVAESFCGVNAEFIRQGIVDAERPSLLLECGEDALLIRRRFPEPLDQTAAVSQFTRAGIPFGHK